MKMKGMWYEYYGEPPRIGLDGIITETASYIVVENEYGLCKHAIPQKEMERLLKERL